MLRENSAMNIVLLTKFHYSKFIMASTIPFDLFVSFAEFGGDSLAYHLAQTCRGVKWRLDQRYEIKRTMTWSRILNRYTNRRAVFGKIISVYVYSLSKPSFLPSSVKNLYVRFLRKRVVLPPQIEHLHIRLTPYKLIKNVASLNSLRELTISDITHEALHHLKWPPNLEKITSGSSTLTGVVFPKTLRVCQITSGGTLNFDRHTFPDTLDTLETEGSLDGEITELPSGLRHLKIGWVFSHALPPFPKNLKSLEIGGCWKDPEPLPELPNGLEHLVLKGFHNLFDVNLPVNLKYCSSRNVARVHDRLIAMGMIKKTDICYVKIV